MVTYTHITYITYAHITYTHITHVNCMQVVTYTSDIRGASTDANVYVDIRGAVASTGKVLLKNANKDCFERGAGDEFEVRRWEGGVLRGSEGAVEIRGTEGHRPLD